MNKKTLAKVTGTAAASFLIAGTTAFTAFAAMPQGTVVIGDKAYDLDYANDPKNEDEIYKAMQNANFEVYVKDFEGNWIINETEEKLDDIAKIPAVEYKDAKGKVTEYHAKDGDKKDKNDDNAEVSIKSVTPLNLKQIKVEFNETITDSEKKDDVEDEDNYELRNADGDKIEERLGTKGDEVAFEKAELDESGKFVILTISDAVMANQEIEVDGKEKGIDNDDDDKYVNNQAKYKLVIDENITGKDDVEKEFKISDYELPEVKSAEVVGKDTIKVKFSEPLAPQKITTDEKGHERVAFLDKDTFEINNDDISVDEVRLCDNHNEANIILASDLKDGEKIKVDVKSKAKDYAGYALKKDKFDTEVKQNKEKLKIVGYKNTDNTKITLVFNKDIKFGEDANDDYAVDDGDKDFMKNFYHTNTKNTAETATIDGNELKLTFKEDYKLSGTVYVYVDADAIQDLWEVENDDLFIKADIDIDNTKPEIKKVEQGDKDTEIKVKFSEKVKKYYDGNEKDHDSDYKDAAGDNKDNYTVKDEDGKEVKISSISLNSDAKEATLVLRDSLDAGDEYTVEVKDVEDIADNKIKKTSVKFKAKGAAVEQKDIKVSAYNRGENKQKIVVDFDTKMKTGDAAESIENLNNYTIEVYDKDDNLLDRINASDYYKAKAKAISNDNKVEITLPGDKSKDEDQYCFGGKDNVEVTSKRFSGKGAKVKVVIGRVSDSQGNRPDTIAYKPEEVRFDDAVWLNDDDDNLIATAPDTIKVTWDDELSFDKDDVSIVAVDDDDKEIIKLKPSKTDVKKKDGVTTVIYTLDKNYKGGDKNYIKGNNELNYDATITLTKDGDSYKRVEKGTTADGAKEYKVAIKTIADPKSDNEYSAKLVSDKTFIIDDNIAPDIAKLKKDNGTMLENNDSYKDRDDYDDNIKVVEFNRVTKKAKLELTFEEDINPESLSVKSFETTDDDIDVTKVYMGDSKNVVCVDLDLTDFGIKDTDTVDSVLGGLGLKSVNSISDLAMTHNYNNGGNKEGNRENKKARDYNYNGDLDLEIPEISDKDGKDLEAKAAEANKKAAEEEAAKITSVSVQEGKLVLPEVKGYDVTIKSSNKEAVIDKAGKVTATAEEEKVNVVLTLTKSDDKAITADTKEIEVTVAADAEKAAQELANAKSQLKVVIDSIEFTIADKNGTVVAGDTVKIGGVVYTVSADGRDVASSAKWVTTTHVDTLVNAVKAAQTDYEDNSKVATDLGTAKTTLEDAINTFTKTNAQAGSKA